jgi:hypothetical protein
VEFPYEYVPLPRKGDLVACGDREGRFVTEGRVVSVKNPKAHDGTAVVAVEVPKAHGLAVRTLCRKERAAHG